MLTLSQLGPFKIEPTEDYQFATTDEDRSYCEMIRIRGSPSDPPGFAMPSHLYKISDQKLAIYAKDKKNLWRPLGKLLNVQVVVSDEEMDFIFPVEMFSEVAKIVPLVMKRGRHEGTLTREERERGKANLSKYRKEKMKQNNPALHSSLPHGIITFRCICINAIVL